MTTAESANTEYAARIATEIDCYRAVENVADLPAIYGFWSMRYVHPKLQALGVDSLDQFYLEPVVDRCRAEPRRLTQVLSLGSGNGELEVGLARSAVEQGCRNLRVTCLEINPDMRDRAQRAATDAGVQDVISLVPEDLNTWTSDREYDVVIASHSLHHVLSLEHLLDQVRSSLGPKGIYLVNDMIGRNGHMRWPEALRLVHEVWYGMPERYRFNHQLRRYEHLYENWDCSSVGFEGVRAQDILPLLLQRFHPRIFFAFANVIDVFVDRGFGHNFDPNIEEDREFIDRVAKMDELAIDLGMVKPTHLIASFGVVPTETRCHGGWTPQFCLRDPTLGGLVPAVANPPAEVRPAEPVRGWRDYAAGARRRLRRFAEARRLRRRR
jgi:SAM-dependent methyltransferase